MDNNILYRKHPWIYSLKKRISLSLMLALLVIFILIFLKPFDTGEKQLPYKNLMLAGYGICILLADLLLILIERLWVLKMEKRWLIGFELIYLAGLFFISSILIYCYDLTITKQTSITWDYLLSFSYKFIVPFAILLLPVVAYFRYLNGKILSPERLRNPIIHLSGQNKDDNLKIPLQQLLCIKAEDNYIRIIYIDDKKQVRETLMRNTLSEIARQINGLIYCHRSYLIAPWQIQQVVGNKQKAHLILNHYLKEVPLSSAHYTSIKKGIST
ncbi:LytTR family transcriptional regulator [Marivirga sp. S37H4]|uniref:LytTR family transcriptional regulator n=1 Tax=Marivirga aurantiaca TaxID=2802615 RepID=A0A935C757_9BACT|nr:LytTR family DNA-binding domain-containing protein [Marivirga aurantiaca]MBK6264162.1 LytTR family transcriptional regulator [Marivirga aurantiaca]